MYDTKEIVGMANYPDVNKYRIKLDCGHTILYDHSVDSIEEYRAGDRLICYQCIQGEPL